MPAGAPTKYDPKYCQEILEFFNVEPVRQTTKTITTKNGTTIEEEGYLANPMPFLVDFCDKIGITKRTLLNWTEKHEEFLHAYTRAKEYQERHLVNNALVGNYNAGFASLVAKNWLGWKEKSETDVTSGGEKISVQVVDFTHHADDNPTS